MSTSPVHVFWDHSNIYYSAANLACERDGIFGHQNLRLHVPNLLALAMAGRALGSGTCVGSVVPRPVTHRLEAAGFRVQLLVCGARSGREQGVDETLQTCMLRAAMDCEPAVAVLLTGDGAGYESGLGFRADLERLAALGWGVELLSWRHSCNAGMRQFVEGVGVFIALDDYYASITFMEGGRLAAPLSLRGRRTAAPRPLPPSEAA